MRFGISRLLPSKKPADVRKDKTALLVAKKTSENAEISRLRRLNSDSWSWETIAIGFSLACSVALIIVLREYDSDPTPKWRYGITLNAVISVLATAAKSSLSLAVAEALSQHKWLWFRRSEHKLEDFNTFDSASRGPWGALNLLVDINVRDIASIGALITVLSLAFDPFMQQVVAYNLRTVHFANTTIGRTPHYAEDHNTADLYGTSLKLRAAMYNGLFNGNAAQQLTPVCPTGNRTWDPMSSLAICSSCENLAPESALSCNRTTPVNRQGGIGSNTLIEANVTCKYTMSQWLQDFTVQEYKLTDGSSIGGQVLQVSALHAIGLAAAENLTFAGKKNPWAGFARVMIDSSYSTKFTNVTVCSFYPCIKTYNISVSGGNFVSHNLHTWSSNPYYLDSYDVGNIVLLAPRDAVSSSTTNTTFSVEVYTGGGLVTLLEDAFNGSATGPPHPNDYEFEFNFYTSDIMQALYMTDDLGQLMDNVAASITNHMRNISSEPALGKVWAIQTYVHVRWIWLVLPMALAPASLLFLLTAIWSSKRKGVQVWKSSALADIFHGLESPVDVRNVDQQSDMEHVSKEVFVRLQQTNGGIQKLVCRDDVTAPANCDLVQTALPAVGNQERRWSDPATAHSQRNGNGTASFLIPRRPVGSGPGSRDDPEATSHR